MKFFSSENFNNLKKVTEFDSRNQVIHLPAGVDSEFQTYLNKPNTIITVQIDETILEHPKLGFNKLPTWSGECAISNILGLKEEFADYPNDTEDKLIFHAIIFFTLTDIVALFKNRDIAEKIIAKCEQRNIVNVNRPIYTGLKVTSENGRSRYLFIKIHDLSGLFGKKSLKDTATSLGVNMPDKDELTKEEKENSLLTYLNSTEKFIRYAKGDSQILKILVSEYIKLWDNICSDLGVPSIKVGYTVGGNVSRLTENIIVRNLNNKTVTSEQEIINRFSKKLSYQQKPVNNYREIVLALNHDATAKSLKDNIKYTSQYLSMVDGGRCKNERPRDVTVEGLLADIDISSCYANGLLNQIYPAGIPVIIGHHKDALEERMTLEQFLNEYEKELVPGLWYARVSTIENLSFEQDILISKIPPKKITAASSDDLEQDESEEILGDFILLTKEVKYAVLNHDLLQVIRTCTSDNELKELKKKLVFEAAIFYPASQQVNNMNELVETFEKTDKSIKKWVDKNKNYISHEKDARSRHWIGLKMDEQWMDIVLGFRQQYPKPDPRNEGFKLVCNSTYGVQASIYFDIANVVVANNITARARTLSWMMTKALGCYQSITDGGIFNLNKVNYWEKFKPGLNTLTNINETFKLSYKTRKNLKTIPLAGSEWSLLGLNEQGETLLKHKDEIVVGCKENWGLIDKLSWKHICNFFSGNIDILHSPGKLVLGFNSQTKKAIFEEITGQFRFTTKDIYTKVSFQSQANYRVVHPNGKDDVKARGYETDKQLYLDPYGDEKYEYKQKPIEDCLSKIADNESIPAYPSTYNATVLKLNAWKKASELVKENNLLPGDTTTRRSHLRPISLSMFRWKTYSQYQRWDKRHKSYRDTYGYGIEGYFINPDKTVRYQEAINQIQDSIDAGKNWITKIDQPPSDIEHPYH